MLVEQTLHGYSDGHRLLSSSVDLSQEEERALDMLSDLSGYLPPGTDFESYTTGYPCGRYYVLARTWLDRAARRSGTVLTHSLLFSRDDIASVNLTAVLDSLCPKPRTPVERDVYRVSLDWTPTSAPDPPLPVVSRRLLAALWFGQDARPVLWTEQESAEAAAALLWAYLPSWLRTNHSFCTFALQPRYLGPRLFDFLAVAPGAQGLFYSIRDRAVQCDGRAPPPGAGPLVELSWVDEMAASSTTHVQALWAEAMDRGLPPLAASEIRVFFRYRELRARAKASFAAALSCIDLLRRLAPEDGMAAEEKSSLLRVCLQHARGPDASSRNLLHALDLLERDPHRFAPLITSEVGAYLSETLETRAAAQPDLALRLWHIAARSELAEAARVGILEALRLASSTLSTESWLSTFGDLIVALLNDNPHSLLDVLQAAPMPARASLVASWVLHMEEDSLAVSEAISEASLALGEIGLLLPVRSRLPPARLLDVIDRTLSRGTSSSDHVIARLLEEVSVDTIANWLVQRPVEQPLPPQLADGIASKLAEPSVGTVFFNAVERSQDVITVLAAYSERFGAGAAARVVRSSGSLAALLIASALADPLRPAFVSLIPEIVVALDPRLLSSLVDPATLPIWEDAPWARALVERVVPLVLTDFLREGTTPSKLRAWLGSGACQAWLRAGIPRSIAKLFTDTSGQAAVRALDLLLDPAGTPFRASADLVRDCLQSWARGPTFEIVALVPGWAKLVKSITDPQGRAAACGLSLQVALDRRDAALAPLAEVGFATAHRQLLQDGSHRSLVLSLFFPLFYDDDWDRAGRMRDTLARTWVEHGWPPLSLLRVADGDVELFSMLASRAKEQPGGKNALRRLLEAARSAADQPPEWEQMLAQLPRSVREE
ncbi:MAG: hypothetical protein R3B70_39420 [Polyangiaceae bacterium]